MHLAGRTDRPFWIAQSDPTTSWENVIEFDISDLEPRVAAPPPPASVSNVREAVGTRIHQAFIGGCTNGRGADLRTAAQILGGRQVHADARLIVILASQKIYAQTMDEGVLTVLLEVRAAIYTPSWGPFVGIDKSLLA